MGSHSRGQKLERVEKTQLVVLLPRESEMLETRLEQPMVVRSLASELGTSSLEPAWKQSVGNLQESKWKLLTGELTGAVETIGGELIEVRNGNLTKMPFTK
ncbi:Uncharacterized protein Fot_38422 [Forsythia ovata]|uniref:Uncharacterized protein n=1 Tax=Forsythia ovata TaxID=205694 RepID=A0ABD1S1T4_9LAMI